MWHFSACRRKTFPASPVNLILPEIDWNKGQAVARWRSWWRRCAVRRKVAGSIPDWLNSSNHTMAANTALSAVARNVLSKGAIRGVRENNGAFPLHRQAELAVCLAYSLSAAVHALTKLRNWVKLWLLLHETDAFSEFRTVSIVANRISSLVAVSDHIMPKYVWTRNRRTPDPPRSMDEWKIPI